MAGPGGHGAFLLAMFVLISSLSHGVLGLENFLGQCGLTIDLLNVQSAHSGVLRMPLPQSMSRYQDPTRPINCDIIIAFPSGTNLLIELYFLDIMPRSNDVQGCTTGLEVFDQTGSKYYGSRLCMEGWQWEERHREKRYEKHLVPNSPLTFRLVSQGPYRGEGFRVHFNQVRPTWPCFIQEFKCQQIQRCVHDDVTCDGWDDCGDYSDEREEAGCNLLTASEICSLLMGILLLLGVAVECVSYFITSRRLARLYGLEDMKSDKPHVLASTTPCDPQTVVPEKKDSKLAVVGSKYHVEPADFGMGQQYNSEDSLPSRYSRSSAPGRKRQESQSDSVRKEDLEKGNRQSKPSLDIKAEQDNRSSAGRKRTQSEGTMSSQPTTRAGRKGRTSSQSSLNRDRVGPVSGIDNPALENTEGLEKGRERLSSGDRDQRSRDQSGRSDRYSDHYSDSDSDYNDRRRRGSRERDYRKNNGYSNEKRSDRRRRRSYGSDDSDYEYDRERRRRSRERFSRDRYDDYSDSDKEKYRREDGSHVYKLRERSDSRDGDRNPSQDNTHEEDDNDRSVRHNKGNGDRRHAGDDRDHRTSPRKGSRQSRSPDDLHSLEAFRQSPGLPLPPPYSEEDTGSLDEYNYKWPLPEEDLRHVDPQNTKLPPSNNNMDTEQDLKQQSRRAIDEGRYRPSSGDRRDRYSQDRWTPKMVAQSSPPPQYRDISKSAPVAYREESV